jgi:hypothetical protein
MNADVVAQTICVYLRPSAVHSFTVLDVKQVARLAVTNSMARRLCQIAPKKVQADQRLLDI